MVPVAFGAGPEDSCLRRWVLCSLLAQPGPEGRQCYATSTSSASPTPAGTGETGQRPRLAPQAAALPSPRVGGPSSEETPEPGDFPGRGTVRIFQLDGATYVRKVGSLSATHFRLFGEAREACGAVQGANYVWRLPQGELPRFLELLRAGQVPITIWDAPKPLKGHLWQLFLQLYIRVRPGLAKADESDVLLVHVSAATRKTIVAELECTARNVRRNLVALEEEGYVRRDPSKTRVLYLYPAGDAPALETSAPLKGTSTSAPSGLSRPLPADVDVRSFFSSPDPSPTGSCARPQPDPGPKVVLVAAATACPAAAPAGRDEQQLPLTLEAAPAQPDEKVVLVAAATAGAAPSAAAKKGGADVAAAVEIRDVRPPPAEIGFRADVAQEADVHPPEGPAAASPPQVVLGATAPACPAAAPAGRDDQDEQLALAPAPAPAPPEPEVLVAAATAGAAPSARALEAPRQRPHPPQRRHHGRLEPGAPPPPLPSGPALWVEVREQLIAKKGAASRLWFGVVQCHDAGRGRLLLTAPGRDDDFRTFVERQYGPLLCELAEAATGEPYRLEWAAAPVEHHASA